MLPVRQIIVGIGMSIAILALMTCEEEGKPRVYGPCYEIKVEADDNTSFLYSRILPEKDSIGTFTLKDRHGKGMYLTLAPNHSMVVREVKTRRLCYR